MSNWEKVRLGDVCNLVAGFAFKSADFKTENGAKVVKIANIVPPYVDIDSCDLVNISSYNVDKLRKYVVSKGDYVFAMTGATIGKVGLITEDEDLYINQRVLTFRPNNNLCDKRFLFYVLNSTGFKGYVNNFVDSDTAQPNISAGTIANYKFSLPSVEEQRRIAGILGALDDKIEVNNRINRNLEQQAESLFRRWFVDFEFPDTITPNNPNGTPYLTSGGTLTPSPLGPIPLGWSVGTFTDIISILGGGTPKTTTEEFWNGEIPFFTPKDANNCYALVTEKSITESGLNACNSRLHPKNTVFITARGTVGKVSLAGCDMAMNQSCYALVGKNGYEQLFAYQFTKQAVILLRNKANGAVFDAITTRDFESENVVIPAIEVAAKFESTVKPLFDTILNNIKENQTLAQMRDALLPKLMNNQIKL